MKAAVVALLPFLAGAAFADTPVRYKILFQEHEGGAQITRVRPDGVIEVDYSYRDNGRGPDLVEQIRLGPDGIPVSHRVRGTSTFGAPVSETFSRNGAAVEWRSSSDRGKTTVSGPAIYVPVESSPEVTALIARAIARQPGHRLAALPGGELGLEKLLDTSVTADARGIPLSLYAITGLSTRPDFVWLTADAQQRFFAFVYPGYLRVIEAGWESQGPALERLQVRAEGEWLERLAAKLARRLPQPVLFRNVRVFDSRQARLLEPADVYVNNGEIAAIYPTQPAVARNAGTVIEGAERVLMPGLFDMHTHEDAWNLLLQIAGGVTTSRDMGNDNAILADIVARVDSGRLAGPRIVPAGYIEGESPFASRGGFVVKDVQSAKDAIDWYAQRGYRQIKIYNSFRPEWVEPVAAYAHERGLRVSGHVPAFMRAEEAVRAGYDEIQHINQVMLNFFVRPEDDTRTLARFYLIGENTHALDLASPQVDAFIDLLKSRHTVIDTTLATFEAMFNQQQGEMNPSFAAIASHVPVGLQREWRTNSMNVTAANVAKYRASYARLLEMTDRMHRAGIELVAGTDDIAGFTLHRELELYVRAGIPAAEALRIATWNGAKYTGTLDRLGSIEPHKLADLILVDGDPVRNISDVRRVSLVMKSGVVYFPAEVYESLGVKRFVDPPAIDVATGEESSGVANARRF